MGFHLTESPYDPYGSGLGPIDQYASPGLGPFPLSPDRLRGLFALMLPPARSFLRVERVRGTSTAIGRMPLAAAMVPSGLPPPSRMPSRVVSVVRP